MRLVQTLTTPPSATPTPPFAVPEKIVGLPLFLDFFDRGTELIARCIRRRRRSQTLTPDKGRLTLSVTATPCHLSQGERLTRSPFG